MGELFIHDSVKVAHLRNSWAEKIQDAYHETDGAP